MKYRQKPKIGEVVAVPLDADRWIYLCFYTRTACYLYDFISQGVVEDLAIFERSHWLTHFYYDSRLPLDHRTVTVIEMTEEDRKPWRIEKIPQGWIATNEYATRSATEEDRQTLPLRQSTKPENLRAFLSKFLPSLSVIQGSNSLMLPVSEVEEQTEVRFVVDVDEDYDELAWSIVDEATRAGIELDTPGGFVLTGQIKDTGRILSLVREAIQSNVPSEMWADINIHRYGPNDDHEHEMYPLMETPS